MRGKDDPIGFAFELWLLIDFMVCFVSALKSGLGATWAIIFKAHIMEEYLLTAGGEAVAN